MTFRPTSILSRTSLAATAVAGMSVLAACGGTGSTAAAHSTSVSTSTAPSSAAPAPVVPSPRSTTSSAHAAPKKVSRSTVRPQAVTSLQVKTVRLQAHVVRKSDSTLAKGKTKVLRTGVAGTQQVTTRRTSIGHTITSSNVIKRVTTKAPVAELLAVGTKVISATPPTGGGSGSSTGLDLRRSGMWDQIASCESGNDWSINTGNGYYGGLQFNAQTWLANGGGRFAPRADLASRAEQITIANHLYDHAGGSPWTCA